MSEYFYSHVSVSDPISMEEEEVHRDLTGKSKDRHTTLERIKVSLKGIRWIFPTGQDNEMCITYDDGEQIWIHDSFERVDKLHNEYLIGYTSTILSMFKN